MDTMPVENICLSGGAEGADTEWGIVAKLNGHKLAHYTFDGHRGCKSPDSVILDESRLTEGDEILKAANFVLKRSFPAHSAFVTKLLRRNFWQVRDTTAVYAIAVIDWEKNTVFGGTAWAIECFKIIHPESSDMYVYDQQTNKWYQWSPDHLTWNEISYPPTPKGRWTGIGARELNAAGRLAISSLWQ